MGKALVSDLIGAGVSTGSLASGPVFYNKRFIISVFFQ